MGYTCASVILFSSLCMNIDAYVHVYILYSIYFVEMMPALHNYIIVDTPTFLSNPENLQIIYNMCKQVSDNYIHVHLYSMYTYIVYAIQLHPNIGDLGDKVF